MSSNRHGHVRVYNTSLLDQLVLEESITSRKNDDLNRSVARTSRRERERIRQEHRRQQFEQSQVDRRRKQEEELKERIKEEKDRSDAKFSEMIAKLETGREMVDSVDRYIALHEDNKHLKLEKMHGQWNEKIFKKIQSAIDRGLVSMKQRDIDGIKRKCFQEFLDASNSKGALFLDTILDDYDPFKMKQSMPKMEKVSTLDDPSRRILDKHLEEEALVSNARTLEDGDPKTREILQIHHWADGKIQATPHGHFNHMMGKEPSKEHKMTKSRVPFEHYDIYRGKCDEYPKGKRIFLDKVNKSSIRLRDSAASTLGKKNE